MSVTSVGRKHGSSERLASALATLLLATAPTAATPAPGVGPRFDPGPDDDLPDLEEDQP